MQIQYSDQLLYLGGAIFLLWVLTRFLLLPRLRRSLVGAGASQLGAAGARYGLFRALGTFLDAAIAALLIVAAGSVALQWHLTGLPKTASVVSGVVEVRNRIEQVLDQTAGVSSEVWAGSLLLLALVWLIASRSGSRRRWDAALGARRSALTAALVGVNGDALKERAAVVDPAGTKALEDRIARLKADNDARVKAVLAKPVIQIGEDTSNVASLADLGGAVAHFRQQAAASVDDDAAAAADLDKSATSLEKKYDEIAGKLAVNLITLAGQVRDAKLRQVIAGSDTIIGLVADRDAALRSLIVDGQLKQHALLGQSKARREPELIREWLAAGATSFAAVNTTSAVGRASGFTAIVLIMVGGVGLGVKQLGPAILEQINAIELQIVALNGKQDLEAQMARAAAEPAPAIAASRTPSLASDQATTQALQQAFRSSVAHTFRQNLHIAVSATETGDGARLLAARGQFELGAVDARHRILAASARQAAPNLELGQAPQVFRASENGLAHAAANDNFANRLDETINRRIEVLRRNETVWTRLRAAAAHPAPANFVGDAFLRTAFLGDEFAVSNTMRVWTEQASYQFAAEAARTGGLPKPGELRVFDFSGHPPLLSVRDQRLIADYRSAAPERIAATLEDVHSGRVDPGSLHRDLPPGYRAPANGNVPRSLYTELFPASQPPPMGGSAATDGAGLGSGGGGGGGGGGRESARTSGGRGAVGEGRAMAGAGRSGTLGSRVASAIPSARSFGRIRFSGRIGGVLIGIPPTPGGSTPDIQALSWQIDGKALRIGMTDAKGARIELGPFHPAIAHHALAYAADGRVVTSTLPQPPRPDPSNPAALEIKARRVLVHPAFEDTAFACRAIQVDRFVDGFTHDTEPILIARYGVTLLNDVLLDARSGFEDEAARKRLPQEVGLITQHARSCGTGASCFPVETYSKLGLSFGGASAFLKCVAGPGQPGGATEAKPDLIDCLQRLVANPTAAAYLVDSGVREVPFKLDKDLAFLTGAGARNDPLWPLDFMIQVVPQSLDGGDVEVSNASEPWRFPSIDQQIKAAVAAGINKSPEAKSVLDDMKAFTVLQRLFRAALAGDLGVSFPLSELVALQEATARFVKVERSERWNVNDALVETLIHAQEEIRGQVDKIAVDDRTPQACRAAARTAVTAMTANSQRIDGAVWRGAREVEQSCGGAQATKALQQRLAELRANDLVEEAIRLSQQGLGAHADYACGPL